MEGLIHFWYTVKHTRIYLKHAKNKVDVYAPKDLCPYPLGLAFESYAIFLNTWIFLVCSSGQSSVTTTASRPQEPGEERV